MSAYGIRDAQDLDFIHHGYDDIQIENIDISSHNSELHYHVKNKDEIIFYPNNYFYYDGVKFATLKIIKEMKKKRNEYKDIKDVNMINSFLEKKYSRKVLFYFSLKKIVISQKASDIKNKIYRKMTSILKRARKYIFKISNYILTRLKIY